MRIYKPGLTKFFLAIILIPIGLLTKVNNGFGREFIANYLGGVIYVIFFILLASLVLPKTNAIVVSLIVLCITCLIELSQLIQNDYLNGLRTHFLIRALIGSVYNVFDFLFYFVGAVIGYCAVKGLDKVGKVNSSD
jgi:hypothetical protein